MVLGLKFHLPTHHISHNPFSNPNRTPQTPLSPSFRFKPIEKHSFPQLQLKLRIKNPNRFKSEESNSNGGGGGGDADDLTKDEDEDGDRDRDGDKVWRFYLRCFELLLRLDRDNVTVLGLSGTMAWVCVQGARLIFEAVVEALVALFSYMLNIGGVVILSAGVGVALLRLWF